MADRLTAGAALRGRLPARTPSGWLWQASWAPLLLLLAAVPWIRALPGPFAGTAGSRVLIVGLELGFVLLALTDRGLVLPRLSDGSAPVRAGLALWVAGSLLALAFSPHAAPGLLRQAEWWGHGLFGVVLWAQLRSHPKRSDFVLAGLAAGAVLYAMLLFASALGLARGARLDWQAAAPGFANTRNFGYYVAYGLGLLAAGLVTPTPRLRWVVFFAASCGAWGLLFWSGSRGALVAVSVSLCGVALLRLVRPWRSLLAASLAAALVGAGLSSLLPRERDPGNLGIPSMTSRTSRELSQRRSVRLVVWQDAGLAVVAHPVVGLGPEGFAFEPIAARRHITQPHDVLLQAALAWGLPGAVGFLLLAAAIWTAALQRSRARSGQDASRAHVGAFIALTTLSIYSAVDGPLYHAFPLMLVATAAAVALQPRGAGNPVVAGPETRRQRLGWGAVALVPVVVLALHVSVMLSLTRATIPEPDALRARLVHAFPSRIRRVGAGNGVAAWIRSWSRQRPEEAARWLHWAHDHSRRPARLLAAEARILLARGDVDAARQHLERAVLFEADPEVRRSLQASLDSLDRMTVGPGE